MRFNWTPDKIELLRAMQSDGATVAEITVRTGARNQRCVMDKLRDLDLWPTVRPVTGFGWDERKITILVEMHDKGHSSSQIGRVLGCSRNAVIGKLHRLGRTGLRQFSPKLVKAKPQSKPIKPKTSTRKQEVAELHAEPLPPRQETDIARKRLVDLEPGDCRFPVGDPGSEGFGFCAAPSVVGTRYCKHHFVRCFLPPAVKPRKPFIIYDRPFTVEKEQEKV